MLRTYLLTGITIFLVGCGSGGGGEFRQVEESDPWPIRILIEPEQYIHAQAIIDGEPLRCIFDTGAPGIWLPERFLEHGNPTVAIGNYERTGVSAYTLPEDKDWTGCLFGLPFFEGFSEFRINIEEEMLDIR